MPAPTGNSNAEKWTLDHTLEKLHAIEQLADRDHITHLGRALAEVHCYSGIWTYWKKRWADNGEVMDIIGYVEQVFINKLLEGAMSRRLHPGTCMFLLRNYGMTDRLTKKQQQAADEKEDMPQTQAQLEEIVTAKVAEQVKEKVRIINKVLDYNEAHPERTIPVHGNYLDVQPPGPCIRHSGDFYSTLY